MQPLTNARWGFTSSCFVCEASNPAGLRLPFFHDETAGEVVAEFTLGARFSGAPNYLHGGIVLSVLDEAMAWAAIAIAGQWAVTRETSTRFERPVRVDRPHRVRARIEPSSTAGSDLAASAEILDGRDRICATARASFTPLGAAQALDAIGEAIDPAHRSFLRED
jgi:uncharacterized protein (TIGR00369 family)